MRIAPLALIIFCFIVARGESAWGQAQSQVSTETTTVHTSSARASDTVNTKTVPRTTTTTESGIPIRTSPPAGLQGRPLEQSIQRSVEVSTAQITPERIRKDHRLARRLAKSHWLEKAVEADPKIVSAITQYGDAAKILAAHPRLGDIAEADHYLCRQITRWKGAAHVLANNPQAHRVIYYDPEGIYQAIRRDRGTGRRLVHNTMFAQMVIDNPDLSKVLASYM
jgi:hypothetical protein